MSEAHMKRAAEWFLTLHEIPIQDAHQLIQPAAAPAPEPPSSAPTKASGPAQAGQDEHDTPDPIRSCL
ncbi:hypothetical protein ACPPVQ_00470 [Diaminobutyricibacter sp. McL0618]|uniref:hypothetical protein n=1 Tax=Leifsonia sp. McL0618 TaxID=3415677 RepID=UPI003CEF8179